MALINCPECGQQVSDKAAICPHCGVAIAGNPDVLSANKQMEPARQGLSPARQGVSPAKQAAPANNNNIGKKNTNRTILIVAALIAVIIVGVGYFFYNNVNNDNEQEAYENAMACNEAAIMQNYLDMYADAPQAHRDSVMAHLTLLQRGETEWENAVVNNSRSAFENYLRLYPESVHKTEALLKIDSIDWSIATKADNPEAYEKYAMEHPDGEYIDEAKGKMEKLAKLVVSNEEKQKITSVLTSFFMALASQDEEELTMTIDVALNSFLHKVGATKMDVVSYMHRIHKPEDITAITFRMNNDWKIEKIDLGNDKCSYVVDFSVDEKIDRTDDTKETFCSYKVNAKVSDLGKITELNMKKGVIE